jgi:capsular polysaccharide biosynthesis protein
MGVSRALGSRRGPIRAVARPVDAPGQLVSPFEALLLRPVQVAVVALLVATGIVGYFGGKAATYSAQTTLVVGRIDVPANAVPGYVAANYNLAGSYSRFVGTDDHLAAMARLSVAGTTVDDVRASGRVSASNVPDSALIRLNASAHSSEQAVKLADLGAAALVEMIAAVNDSSENTAAVLKEFTDAATGKSLAQSNVERLQRDLAFYLDLDRTAEANATQTELDAARVELEQQILRLNTASALYQERQRSRIQGAAIEVIDSANATGGTRSSDLALGVVVGAVVGLLVGTGVAWLLANGPILRAMRQGLVDRQDDSDLVPSPLSAASWPETDPSAPPEGTFVTVPVPER